MDISHTKILKEVGAVGSSDYITPRYDIGSEQRGLEGRLLKNSAQIHADDSKLTEAVSSGIFSESVGMVQSIRLPDLCSVFQAEVVAIQAAARIIRNGKVSKRNVTILSDNQAAFKALRLCTAVADSSTR